MGAAPLSDDVVRGGVACELVHLGSLYHDDVIDDSDVRRGVETVNAKWGNLQAILAGDFLLSRASEIAASLGTEVAGLLARTIGWLCQGEIEQLRHTYDTTRTEASYLSSITNKTAVLFGTAARIGGLVAALDRHVVETLGRWATSFGMVFQIVDDILDITESAEHLGKPAGHDMEEGVYTLPVLRTLQLGHGVGEELRSLLGKPLDLAERDKALAIVRANEGVESAVVHGAAVRRRRRGGVRRPAAGRGHRRPARGARHAARVSRRGRVARRSALAPSALSGVAPPARRSPCEVVAGTPPAGRGSRRRPRSRVAIGWRRAPSSGPTRAPSASADVQHQVARTHSARGDQLFSERVAQPVPAPGGRCRPARP